MNHKMWSRDKAEDNLIGVKNIETTLDIEAGRPMIFAMSGTDDGLGVVLPSSSTAAKIGAFTAGVAVRTLGAGKQGDCQVYGFNRNTKVVRGTRAASTDAWPSFAAFAIGDILSVDSTNNCFGRFGAASNLAVKWPFVIAEALASVTTMASSVLGGNAASATVYLQTAKSFIKMM